MEPTTQTQSNEQKEDVSVIRPLDGGSSPSSPSFSSRSGGMSAATYSTKAIVIIFALAVFIGVGSGFGLAQVSGSSPSTSSEDEATGSVKTEKSAGVKDEDRFPDQAEGKLVEGGIEGEGSFHLERPGGESQNVYMTSSIVDLSNYVGKKVTVWGETFEGQKAGWLMDIGYIELQ